MQVVTDISQCLRHLFEMKSGYKYSNMSQNSINCWRKVKSISADIFISLVIFFIFPINLNLQAFSVYIDKVVIDRK